MYSMGCNYLPSQRWIGPVNSSTNPQLSNEQTRFERNFNSSSDENTYSGNYSSCMYPSTQVEFPTRNTSRYTDLSHCRRDVQNSSSYKSSPTAYVDQAMYTPNPPNTNSYQYNGHPDAYSGLDLSSQFVRSIQGQRTSFEDAYFFRYKDQELEDTNLSFPFPIVNCDVKNPGKFQ